MRVSGVTKAGNGYGARFDQPPTTEVLAALEAVVDAIARDAADAPGWRRPTAEEIAADPPTIGRPPIPCA